MQSVTHDKLPVVMADGGQLVQLLQNLIGNAIKFHGQRAASVFMCQLRTTDGIPCFPCSDNGIGIAPEYFDRLFKIFQRFTPEKSILVQELALLSARKLLSAMVGVSGLNREWEKVQLSTSQ